MAYLNEIEKQTVEWFRAIVAEATGRCEATKLDPLGTLIITLPPDPPQETAAWLSYIAAQAPGKKAVVSLAEHGVLVLILPRYAKAKQEALPLAISSREEGRQSSLGSQEGPQLRASEGKQPEALEEGRTRGHTASNS